MKKFLYVATVYSHISAFHLPYLMMLKKQGYEVHVAANYDNNINTKPLIEEKGIICHDISFSKSLMSLENIKSVKMLNNLFEEHRFELIHVHTPIASFITRFTLRKFKNQGPLIYTAHGFHFFKGAPLINWLLFYPLEGLARNWTDALIVMNQEDLKNAQKIGFVENETLFFVHGVGVNIKEYSNHTIDNKLLSEFDIDDNDVVISYIAELNHNKNHMYLLDNWKSILKNYSNTKLLIIGTGELEGTLKAYIKEKQLENVYFLGYRHDVDKLLAISDIVTLLSFREGLPKCLMEAMCNSKPCVVSDIRGNRDLISNEKNGFVVPLNEPEKLINSFCKVIESKELRDTFGEEGFKKIQNYDLEKVVTDVSKVYDFILKQKSIKRL